MVGHFACAYLKPISGNVMMTSAAAVGAGRATGTGRSPNSYDGDPGVAGQAGTDAGSGGLAGSPIRPARIGPGLDRAPVLEDRSGGGRGPSGLPWRSRARGGGAR